MVVTGIGGDVVAGPATIADAGNGERPVDCLVAGGGGAVAVVLDVGNVVTPSDATERPGPACTRVRLGAGRTTRATTTAMLNSATAVDPPANTSARLRRKLAARR